MPLASMKFHLSLNVSNLTRAVGFYRVLFGLEPAKCHDDYAKFELAEPPVVFSLVPQASLAGGSLSKLGLRLGSMDAVDATKQRLQEAGITIQWPPKSDGTKFYVADPDLNYWEVATGDDDGAIIEAPQRPSVAAPAAEPASGPVVWEHFITAPLPERIPQGDGSVDEVRLTGTFNATLPEDRRQALLQETFRVLRPGGKLLVHGLVGDRAFAQQPQLPGLAAMVQRVPVQTEPIDALQAAGFVAIQFVKFSPKPWFQIDGVELREVKMIAFKPAVADASVRPVIYRGPLAEAVDDGGTVYPRGQRVAIGTGEASALQASAAAEQFLFLETAEARADCCGTPQR